MSAGASETSDAETRAQLFDAAIGEFRRAATEDEPLRATANGLYALVSALNAEGPMMSASKVDDLVGALGAVVPHVVDCVADDLTHDRIVVALGAASRLVRLYAGPRALLEAEGEETVLDLGHATLWARGALEELHHRREIQKRGDTLFRLTTGRVAFANAVNVGLLN